METGERSWGKGQSCSGSISVKVTKATRCMALFWTANGLEKQAMRSWSSLKVNEIVTGAVVEWPN